ncbi:MAG: hypothetical protein ACXVDH_04935 [Nocardioides sp.]
MLSAAGAGDSQGEHPGAVRADRHGALRHGRAVIGLVLGLRAYVPTAWAAVIEVGLPGALLGALFGLIAGGIATLARRAR